MVSSVNEDTTEGDEFVGVFEVWICEVEDPVRKGKSLLEDDLDAWGLNAHRDVLTVGSVDASVFWPFDTTVVVELDRVIVAIVALAVVGAVATFDIVRLHLFVRGEVDSLT